MKKALRVFLLGIMAGNMLAQSETAAYKLAAEKFVNYYNQNQPENIFALYAEDMKQAVPLEKTKQTVAGLRMQLGKIAAIEFIKYQETYALYKTQFEPGVFILYIALDEQEKINGFYIKPYIPDNLPVIPRNITKMMLPFGNEWFVFWGGDSEALNYHVVNTAQKNAFDFVIVDQSGKTHRNSGEKNEDYYCFAEKLIAPCDGEVVLAVDGVKDNKPQEMDAYFPLGNAVVLKTANNEYLYFCHCQQHTIAVKQGQQVKKGELLGLCGNSGRSSEPHLHFHMQNVENMNVATGIKCFFERIAVNGEMKSDYSPVRNEKIKNLINKDRRP